MDDLVYRLRKRAEIRRQIPDRKSVQEGQPDRIADLLEEAADALAKREWVGLTDDEIEAIQWTDEAVEYEVFDEGDYGYEINIHPQKFARAVEAKLKEKNCGTP